MGENRAHHHGGPLLCLSFGNDLSLPFCADGFRALRWRYVHDDGGLTWFSKNFVYYEGDYRIVRYNAGGVLKSCQLTALVTFLENLNTTI